MANIANLKVKLLHDTIVAGASEPRGEAVYGRAGETHELPRWEALHLCHCHPEFPRAVLVEKKGN
jgi:hypothetical protein